MRESQVCWPRRLSRWAQNRLLPFLQPGPGAPGRIGRGRPMQGKCSSCSAPTELEWKFCPHCGTAAAVETRADIPRQTDPEVHEKSSLPGAFTGLLFGMLAVPILAIVGTMLCLTGLGAILGVPMIMAAILAPLLGPMVGLGALKGKCPWCAIPVRSRSTSQDRSGTRCGSCRGTRCSTAGPSSGSSPIRWPRPA